ncbi:hypothetical protein ACOSP7_003637 [Xanthoceras sorbifolium]
MGLFLGGLIGVVQEIDGGDSGDCMGKFLRVRVLINVQQPLKRGLRFAFGVGGEVCSSLLCYERLSNFCFYCGCMGHLLRECHVNKLGVLEAADLKFGVWLRAPNAGRPKFARGTRTAFEDDTSSGKQGIVMRGNKEQAADKGEEKPSPVAGASVVDNSVLSEKPLEAELGPIVQQTSKVTPEAVETAPASMSSDPTLSENSGSLGFSSTQPLKGEMVNAEVSSPTKKRWKRLARVRFKESWTVSIWGPRGGGSRFHFEQAWADDTECRELVQQACGLGLGSNHMSTLQNSLMAVVVNLGDWNRKKKRASLAELRSLKEELEALYGRSQDRGVTGRIFTVEQQIDGINDRME